MKNYFVVQYRTTNGPTSAMSTAFIFYHVEPLWRSPICYR
jgi:hypothetical protein